jgi:hypothetical protein
MRLGARRFRSAEGNWLKTILEKVARPPGARMGGIWPLENSQAKKVSPWVVESITGTGRKFGPYRNLLEVTWKDRRSLELDFGDPKSYRISRTQVLKVN